MGHAREKSAARLVRCLRCLQGLLQGRPLPLLLLADPLLAQGARGGVGEDREQLTAAGPRQGEGELLAQPLGVQARGFQAMIVQQRAERIPTSLDQALQLRRDGGQVGEEMR